MMSAAQQASSALASAKTAHAVALDALRVAKQEFFEAPTESNRQKVITLEEALSEPALLVERAEFQLSKARGEEAEATRAQQARELADLRSADAERSERVRAATLRLAALEQEAFGLIDEIEAIVRSQTESFHARKRLALALGEAMPERPPPTSLQRAGDVADEIRRAHHRDGRFNKPNGSQVAVWLQPSLWAPPRAKTA